MKLVTYRREDRQEQSGVFIDSGNIIDLQAVSIERYGMQFACFLGSVDVQIVKNSEEE
jgi:hypothetical protein